MILRINRMGAAWLKEGVGLFIFVSKREGGGGGGLERDLKKRGLNIDII